MKQLESDLQAACICWFRAQYPKSGKLLHSIPNGGKRNLKVAMRLKKEGVVPGYPDLKLNVARGGFHGLYIEMKAGKNKPTEYQVEIMDLLREQGYKCEVAYSLDEFRNIITEYLKLQ